MAYVELSFNAPQASVMLLPPVPGRAYRVLRVLVTSWGTIKLQLLSNPGAAESGLLPPLHNGNRVLDLTLGRRFAVSTPPGASLGVSATFQGAPGESSLAVWYDLV